MRHRHSRLRLRQKPVHARSMTRNLVTSVLLYETVRTTKKRAEVVQPMVDRLITEAKTKPTYLAIRAINKVVTHKNASRKIIEVLKSRFADRPSGFTRVTPLGARHGDGAKMVTLSLIEGVDGGSEEKSTKSMKSKKSMSASRKTKDSSGSSVS